MAARVCWRNIEGSARTGGAGGRQAGFRQVLLRGGHRREFDQLKHGVHALRMPVSTHVSNGAYMVMASLAWALKAWFAYRLLAWNPWQRVFLRGRRGAAVVAALLAQQALGSAGHRRPTATSR